MGRPNSADRWFPFRPIPRTGAARPRWERRMTKIAMSAVLVLARGQIVDVVKRYLERNQQER